LPGTGPYPEQFSATGKGTHSEGFVVEIQPEPGDKWVGNFQPGLTRFSGIFAHPDDTHIIVVSGGQGYIVDPKSRELVETFGGQLQDATQLSEPDRLLFHNGLWFIAFAKKGLLWRSRRISWDGLRDISIEEDRLTGEGYNVLEKRWQRFEVSLENGEAHGGAYHLEEKPRPWWRFW